METKRAEEDSASIQECCPEAVVIELVYNFEKRNQMESILSNFPSSNLVSTIMVIKVLFYLSDVFLLRSSKPPKERVILIFIVFLG